MNKSLIYKYFLIILLPISCAESEPLNSERIRDRYGNYQLEIVYADSTVRIADLFTVNDDIRTTRTLAVVEFSEQMAAELANPHATVVAGGSIGETLKAAGWTISKEHLEICSFEAAGPVEPWLKGMGLKAQPSLASHTYELSVSKAGVNSDYARITEVHHPDYLDVEELATIYDFSALQADLACRQIATRLPTPSEDVRDR